MGKWSITEPVTTAEQLGKQVETGRDRLPTTPEAQMTLEPPEAPVAEREVVAAQRENVGGHEHITKVKFSDGGDMDAADLGAGIEAHAAHYVMRKPDLFLPVLLQVINCPDCGGALMKAEEAAHG